MTIAIVVLGFIVPAVGLFSWTIGLFIYGYKKGYLGGNQSFGPEDFWVGGMHGGNVNIDIHSSGDHYTPIQPTPKGEPSYLGTNVVNDVVHVVTGFDIKNGSFDGN